MSRLDDAFKNSPVYLLLILAGAFSAQAYKEKAQDDKKSAQAYKERAQDDKKSAQDYREDAQWDKEVAELDKGIAELDKDQEEVKALLCENSDFRTAWDDLEQINDKSPEGIKKSNLQDDAIKRIKDAVEQHRTIVVKLDKTNALTVRSLEDSSEALKGYADCLEDSARGNGAPNPDVERAIQSLRTAASGDKPYLNKPAVRQIIEKHGF